MLNIKHIFMGAKFIFIIQSGYLYITKTRVVIYKPKYKIGYLQLLKTESLDNAILAF